jgi:predicted transcriptional regulator
MSGSIKTTVYLNADDYRRLKALANAQGGTAAEMVREAVAEYVLSRGSSARPTSIGIARSQTGQVAERAEDLLADGFGR